MDFGGTKDGDRGRGIKVGRRGGRVGSKVERGSKGGGERGSGGSGGKEFEGGGCEVSPPIKE